MPITFHSALQKSGTVCDENGNEIPEPTDQQFREQLQAGMEHQTKCKADAVEFVKFYFNADNSIYLELLENWLAKNQPLDRWFFIHLIEVSGQIFFDKTSSALSAEKARLKNKIPRVWVLSEWENRVDKLQGKAAFARQYAPLVKKQFKLSVNATTIERDWLPKTKK